MGEGTTGLPTLTFDGATAWLTFNRPEKRNALNLAVWRSLPQLLQQAVARSQTRVIVMRGAGGNFAAGADIEEFDTVFSGRESVLAYSADMAAATLAIEAVPLPVIAMVEGLCIGAGVAVALACDLRLAASDARFAVTPAKLGLMYSLADTRRLTNAVGFSAAKDLLFTGRMIEAPRAAEIGLIDELLETSTLEASVTARAQSIADASSWSVEKAKLIVSRIADGAVSEVEETRGWFADAVETADFREGLDAFKARRKPEFPSR
jgi:enoyl-CoA hydratase/carnithine racemase